MNNNQRKNLPSLDFLSAGYQAAFEAQTIESYDVAENSEMKPLLKLRGAAIFLDRISGNRRKYIAESVHAQVRLLQPRIDAKSLFGELDHPSDVTNLNRLAYVDMHNMSHRIDAIWYDEATKAYWIDVTVFNTPSGRILKAIHDAGSPLFVSLRSILDPARNRQKQGYVEAWMMALITIDFVSQPGFSDAIMQDIEPSNEANYRFLRGVCEAYSIESTLSQLNSLSQSKRMCAKRKQMPALENMNGKAVEPSKEVKDLVAGLIADLKKKFPGKFTEESFMAEYNGMYEGYQLGLYADVAMIALVKADDSVTAKFAVDKIVDGEFKLPEEINVDYVESDGAPINGTAVPVPASEMYQLVTEKPAIIATENWQPTEAFIGIANDVVANLQANHGTGFDLAAFDTVKQELETAFGVTAELNQANDKATLVIAKDGSKAVIDLTVNDGKAIAEAVAEYSMVEPGNEGQDFNPAGSTGVAANMPGTDPSNVGPGAKTVSTQAQAKAAAQQALTDQMYEVIEEGLEPEGKKEEPKKPAEKPKDDPKEPGKTKSPADEIAEEAARIFGMPNSKFHGNYAIEHCPIAYKALWQGASEAAKSVIAKRALDAKIATEAQALRFWASVDFLGIERACLTPQGQAALEHFAPIDRRKSLLAGLGSAWQGKK